MKQFKMIVALLVWLGAVGCSQQEFSETVVPETVEQQEETTIGTRVSKRLAVQRAKNAVKWISEGPQSRSDLLRVERVEVVGGSAASRTDAADTLFYLVNFSDNQGYALVAADERNTDVYMMSDEGSLDLSELDPASPLAYFMEQAEEYALYELDAFDRIPIDSMDRPVNKDDTISILIPEYHDGEWFHVYRDERTIDYGTQLTTRWHQDEPYRNLCFTDIDNSAAPAGCVAVAVGQIMAYHRYPFGYNNHIYNWSEMLATPDVANGSNAAKESVAYLIRDIGDLVNMDYRYYGSYANPENAVTALRLLGYDTGDLIDYSYDMAVASLSEEQPIFAGGWPAATNPEGHAWVIDAAQTVIDDEYFFEVGSLLLRYVLHHGGNYVHCNWGYQTPVPSWTLSDVFTCGNIHYSYNNKMIGYIRTEQMVPIL